MNINTIFSVTRVTFVLLGVFMTTSCTDPHHQSAQLPTADADMQKVLDALAGLEGDDVLLRNVDPIVRARISSPAGLPPTNLEYPEVPQLDSPILDERFNDCVERPLDDFFGFQLGQVGAFGDSPNDLFLSHG